MASRSADPGPTSTAVRLGDDLIFDVRTWGPADGVPVLLLHGFPQTAASWDGVARGLEGRGLRLIAPDQRGYSPGARPADVAAYGVEHLADDVLRIAEQCGHRTFHLVGHDWGAAVSWWLAARHPDRVRTLTALSVPHLAAFGRALAEDPDQQKRSTYIRDFRTPGTGEDLLMAEDGAGVRALFGGRVADEAVERDLAVLRGGALTPALMWYRAMRDFSDTPDVAVPTTYLWGDADQAAGRAAAEACARHVSADYRFVALPGISHWSLDEVPEVVAAEVLRRVAPPSS